MVLLAVLIVFALDGLTFLWVRRVYQIVYHFAIRTKQHQIIMIDIDGFKSINDQYGHPVGNKILRKVGLVILKESRLRGFRYGGEEFAIILARGEVKRATILANHIRQEIGKIDINGLRVTASFGIGQYEEEADKALYRAKAKGKDCVEVSS